MTFKTFLLLSISVLVMVLNKVSAQDYPVLLIVDDSNPSAVTITAAPNAPMVDYTNCIANDGMDLFGFFTANAWANGVWHWADTSYSLTANGVGYPYCTAEPDDFSDNQGASGFIDLNIYIASFDSGHTNMQAFLTSQPAFTGSLTIDFSSLGVASLLPAPGTSGYVVTSDHLYPQYAKIIGKWEVPLPTINILSPKISGTNFSFSFPTTSDQSYTVWGNTNLATTNWISIANFTGNGLTNFVAVPMTNSAQFFRVSAP